MIPIQEGETEPEEESPKVVGGAAGTLATVEYVGTAMNLQTTTTPIIAQSLKRPKMIQVDL